MLTNKQSQIIPDPVLHRQNTEPAS